MAIVSSDLVRLYEVASYDHGERKAPIIGIPLDSVDPRNDPGGFWYSEYPWYAMGRRYCDAIVRAGGVPVMLAYNLSSVGRLAEVLDGVLLAGVGYDIDPIFYGEHLRHRTTVTKPIRSQFEWAIAQRMFERGRPVLGLNAGMQLINVMWGGTLYQHLIEEIPDSVQHAQSTLMVYPHHTVAIFEGTHLHQLVVDEEPEYAASIQRHPSGDLVLKTNSYHHQGVKTLGKGLRVSARTVDGVVEAIELEDGPFCLGVQWNAEFLGSLVDTALMKRFVAAAAGRES